MLRTVALRSPLIGMLGVMACTRYNQQSVLDPAAPESASIHKLFLFMLVVAAIVYVLVVGVTLLIIARREPVKDSELRSPEREARALRNVKIAVGITVPILFIFLVYDLSIGRNLNRMSGGSMLTIDVTGHQWWWEIQYEDPIAQNRVITANEIHIPVGRQVHIKLVSHDVIHSFWVPNLTGKKDLIPGHDNDLIIRADHPGIFRGPCAEYCGVEHAKMALVVIAEPEAQFTDWLKHQRAPAMTPSDSLALAGQQNFETGPCATCHTVTGTRAAARVGPDLTHLKTRLTLAAGTLDNNKGNLAGWIIDPQTIKPGAKMPSNQIEPKDLQALLAYLETLK